MAILSALFLLTGLSPAWSQVTLSSLEQQALSAFNPSLKSFTSVTLSGTAVWTAGSLQESGDVLLKVSTDGSVTETWSLPTQSHSVARAAFAAGRACTYTDPKGTVHRDASLDCQRVLPWFAPWMALELLQSGTLLRDSSLQVASGAAGSTQLLYETSVPLGASPPAALQKAVELGTGVGVSFNSVTALMSQLDFNFAVNSDPAHAIPYRIAFSGYSLDGGLVLPHHIQRYIQRTLQADITITSVTVE